MITHECVEFASAAKHRRFALNFAEFRKFCSKKAKRAAAKCDSPINIVLDSINVRDGVRRFSAFGSPSHA